VRFPCTGAAPTPDLATVVDERRQIGSNPAAGGVGSAGTTRGPLRPPPPCQQDEGLDRGEQETALASETLVPPQVAAPLLGPQGGHPSGPAWNATALATGCTLSAHTRSRRTRRLRPAPELCGSKSGPATAGGSCPAFMRTRYSWSTVSTMAEPKTRLVSLVASWTSGWVRRDWSRFPPPGGSFRAYGSGAISGLKRSTKSSG
jgi:hypothetical protein